VELLARPGVVRSQVNAGTETEMSDDKRQWGLPDRKRIDIHHPDGVNHGSKSLGISPEQLREVAARVGTSAQKVWEALCKL
jgi:hypothetical protein